MSSSQQQQDKRVGVVAEGLSAMSPACACVCVVACEHAGVGVGIGIAGGGTHLCMYMEILSTGCAVLLPVRIAAYTPAEG